MKQMIANFFSLSPDMLAVLDFDGTFLELNSSWEKKLGWSKDELKMTSLFDRIHPDDRADAREAFQNSILDHSSSKFEGRFLHKNTLRIYFFGSIVIDAKTQKILFSAQDKTEQEHTRESIANSQRQLEAVFSSMFEGVIAQDSQGRVVHYNQAALNLLGIDSDQLLGKRSFDPDWILVDAQGNTMGPDQHPAMISQRTGQPQLNVIMGFRRRDGETRWAAVSTKPIFRSGSHLPHQVVISFHDITEEKKSREALVEKEIELSRLMNTMPALIAYWDRNGHNVFSNDRYCAINNLKPADIVGRHP